MLLGYDSLHCNSGMIPCIATSGMYVSVHCYSGTTPCTVTRVRLLALLQLGYDSLRRNSGYESPPCNPDTIDTTPQPRSGLCSNRPFFYERVAPPSQDKQPQLTRTAQRVQTRSMTNHTTLPLQVLPARHNAVVAEISPRGVDSHGVLHRQKKLGAPTIRYNTTRTEVVRRADFWRRLGAGDGVVFGSTAAAALGSSRRHDKENHKKKHHADTNLFYLNIVQRPEKIEA